MREIEQDIQRLTAGTDCPHDRSWHCVVWCSASAAELTGTLLSLLVPPTWVDVAVKSGRSAREDDFEAAATTISEDDVAAMGVC